VSREILPWELLAPARTLFLAHLRGDPAARALLGGRGWEDDAAASAAGERRLRPLPRRTEVAAAVAGYARGLGLPAMAAAAERLADPRAVCVVGGQQPGVAGGPILSFAKAAGVLALAARLEARGGGPVVPVWWVASEDHDRAEAGDVLLAPGARAAALLGPDPGDRRELGSVEAPGAEAILGALGSGPRAAEVRALLAADPGTSLGRAAALVIGRLLGPRGLVVLEPSAIRGLAGEVFAADVRTPGLLAAAVREGNARVRAAGHGTVLADPEGPLHFRRDGSGVRSRGGGTEEDLAQPAARLSADAVLRVLVQDAVLPVAAAVLGPAEMEYHAAILPARTAAGLSVFAPCAVPRPGATILEARIGTALAELGADLPSLLRDGERALRGSPAPPAPLAAEARRLRGELERAAGAPADLPAAVRSRLGRARDGLEDLAAAAERAEAERRGVGEGRRRKVLEALLPDGVPQERKWSLLPFLLRHGPSLADRLVADCSDPAPGHRVIRA
jgi:uncharacterized protein YllA (UPF0747 family)